MTDAQLPEDQERLLQDWGGYEPEVQKALRFVAMTGGVGTAKQMAKAVDREYAKRNKGQSEQRQPVKRTSHPKQRLSEDEMKVLRIASHGAEMGGIELEQALYLSGLDDTTFYRCVDTLVAQRYLGGDALIGFYRTKKPFPYKAMTENDFEAIVDNWIAKHPQVHVDEEQRQFMIRVHLLMQKHAPGWTL